MAIFYNKVERGNPADPAAPKKWYPVLKSLGMVREKEVGEQIADETTLNPKEGETALAQLQKVLIRNLLEGRTVQLGDWKLIHYYEDGREELFNLETDLEENTDVSAENPELTKQLSQELFAYLSEVSARFPEKDPEYKEEIEQQHLEKIKTELMPRLEKQRLEFLSEEFDPGNNWWGSKISKTNSINIK